MSIQTSQVEQQISLTHFIHSQQLFLPRSNEAFAQLLDNIMAACKQIAHHVNKGAILGVLGNAGSENVQGEIQKKLDIITNELMIDAIGNNAYVAGMASEENEDPIISETSNSERQYLVIFDPLDGSSNIDINMTVGTIFSILKSPTNKSLTSEDFLQQGLEQICAGFVLYGPSTLLVITIGNGVNGFTLDNDTGEFVLTHPNIKIPPSTREFAINMSNQRFWEPPVKRYVDECVLGTEGPRHAYFNMRWIASLVAEVYRILTRGGVFMYPYDLKDPTKAGRLRLMYEANPIAFIVEQAGGACITGRQRILSIQPDHIHQRVPLILGSKEEVERIGQYHTLYDHSKDLTERTL